MPDKLILRDWSPEFPTEEGFYWFYGNLWLGQMGMDYYEDNVPEPEMVLVAVYKNVAVANGQFVSRTKFDKANRKAGWLGYWAKAVLPESPYDGNGFFEAKKA